MVNEGKGRQRAKILFKDKVMKKMSRREIKHVVNY